MGRRARVAVTVVAAAAFTGTLLGLPAVLWWQSRSASTTASAATPPDDGPAPSYVLTDQNDRRVSSAEFAGKVQVVSFLFPYCTSYCPEIARQMTVLQSAIAGTPLAGKVEIVAFNVDPGGAGRARMRQFWREFGGNPSAAGVEFLTGTPQQIHHVVTDGYHVFYQKVSLAAEAAEATKQKQQGTYVPQPEVRSTVADQAHVNYDVVHNDFIDIVGPHGRVRSVLDNPTQLTDAALLNAVRSAAQSS